ncbi:MAG: RluA family pseudouridine synthase [Desulfotalea sp.]
MKDNKYQKSAKMKKPRTTSFDVKEAGTLLNDLITTYPNKSRKLLKVILRDRQVLVNNKIVSQHDHPIKPGQQIKIYWDKIETRNLPRELKIVFEDEHLIVINKSSGLLTVATDTERRKTAFSMLSTYVKQEHPDNKIFVVHRLDRETSGLLLFAKTEKIKRAIQETWTTTISERTYIAVVEGELKKEEGVISSYLAESKAFRVYSSPNAENGLHSVTNFKRLKTTKNYSLVQLNLETGRKHQIRVHMQDINHPILGDKKYGAKTASPMRRMGLHAMVLAFTHPVTGDKCHFETPIPKKFFDLFAV